MAALIWSLSRMLGGTSSGNASIKKKSVPGIPISRSTLGLEATDKAGVSRVSHRLSRARSRVSSRHHPCYLSSSRGPDDPRHSSSSPPSERARRGLSPDQSQTQYLAHPDPHFNYSSLSNPVSAQKIGQSKSRSRTKKHIMWEDSGYDSPSLRTERQEDANSPVPSSAQRRAGSPNSRARSVDANLNRNLNRIRSCLRSQQSEPQSESAARHYDDRRSKSEGRLRGMSPSFTSTPIKSEPKERTYQVLTESHHEAAEDDLYPELAFLNSASSASGTEFPKSSNFWNQDLEAYEESFGGSATNLRLKEMVDESVKQIFQEGTQEFDGKGLKWIQQVFQLQLGKMQTRLTQTFSQKLERMSEAKEQAFLDLQLHYRNKLLDFEKSTEKFQFWIETLTSENDRLRSSKDAVISELQLKLENKDRSYQVQLDRERNELQAESEKDKLKLQRKHADQIRAITDKYMSEVSKIEEQFRHQADTLQRQILDLQAHNGGLRRELELGRSTSPGKSGSHGRSQHESSDMPNREREHLLRVINDLKVQLENGEKEKTIIVAAHNREIAELQRETDAEQQHLSNQILESRSRLDELAINHEDDLVEFKERIQKQERAYQQNIDELRRTYGAKIQKLSEIVEDVSRNQTPH